MQTMTQYLMREGKLEGRAEARNTIARNLMLEDVPASIIAKVTGLKQKDIKKLSEALA